MAAGYEFIWYKHRNRAKLYSSLICAPANADWIIP